MADAINSAAFQHYVLGVGSAHPYHKPILYSFQTCNFRDIETNKSYSIMFRFEIMIEEQKTSAPQKKS